MNTSEKQEDPSLFLHKIKKIFTFNIIVPVALSYIAGATVAYNLLPGRALLHWMTGLCALFLFVLLIFHKRRYSLLNTIPLFLLVGMIHTGYALHLPYKANHIYNLINKRSTVTLTGTVTGMPEYDGLATRLIIDADSILFHAPNHESKTQVPTTGKIKITVKDVIPANILPGSHLMAIATLQRASNYQTPGVLNYRLYLANQSIYVTGFMYSTAGIMPYTDLEKPAWQKYLSYPEQVRFKVGRFLDATLDEKIAGMYKALLIGSKSGISEDILEDFKAIGCMHLLAISGIHMGLLGLITAFILQWIMKRSTFLLNNIHIPTAATLTTLPILLFYAFIAGMNTPVLRALVMSGFFLVGIILRRQRSIIHIIAAAALFILLLRPLAIFTASFQLSFSAVIAIAIIYPRLLIQLEKRDLSTKSKIFNYIGAAIFVSIAATLGSLPFMLYHFNRFSLIGPLTNLQVEPFLCLWALPIGLIALPFTYLSPEIAAFLIKTGSLGIIASLKITHFFSQLPLTSFWSITPAPVEIFFYYTILLLWFYGTHSAIKKRTAFVLSALFILYFTKGLWLTLPSKVSTVSFLDIGQGNSTFISMPHGRKILIDGGNKSSPAFDPGERVIAPFLWKKQIWRIDDIIVSHPHSDHYDGLNFILQRFHPKRLWINGKEMDKWPYKELLTEAEQNGVEIITPEKTSLQFTDPKAQLQSVYDFKLKNPLNKETLSINDESLVLRLQHKEHVILFPGDISVKMENILIKNRVKIQANILLAPHHGSNGSGSQAFISTVDPEVIIVSAGKNSEGKYPSPTHLKNWKNDNRTIMETSKYGTITMIIDGKNLSVTTYTNPAEDILTK